MNLAMDHLLISLLNTGLEASDPLETPLGVVRWWASTPRTAARPLLEGKPRFDSGLAAALRGLRSDLEALVVNASPGVRLPFRGDASDALLFDVAYATRAAVADGTLKRIRRCCGGACGRYFLDETKNGSRRWCSLRCMERARAPRRRTISR